MTIGSPSRTITPTFSSSKYTGYSMTLPTALSGGSTTSYQIVATPTSENVTISYSMKNAPDTLAVSSAVEEEETVHYLDVSATARATGTLCIGVHYENLSATYEIGVTVDPNAT